MLAKAFSNFVDAAIRSRGEQYFRDGAVESVKLADDSMTAVVIGSSLYGVLLRRSRHTLFTQCTCPYFTDQFDVCKHIWAAILEADKRGAFRSPKPPSSLELDLPVTGDDEEDFEEDSGGFDESADDFDDPDGELDALDAEMERALRFSGRLPPYAPPFRPSPGRTSKPKWEPALEAALSPRDTRPGERIAELDYLTPGTEIRYVLDGEKCGYELVIVPEFSRPKKSGDGMTMFRSFPGLVPEAVERLPKEDDRNLILHVLTRVGMPSQIHLPFAAAGLILERVCMTGRFYFRQWKDDARVTGPLVWGGAEPFRLTLHCGSGEADWVIAGDLRRGEERLAMDDLVALLPQARLAITKQGVLHRVEAPSPSAFSSMTNDGVIRVPKRATDAFVSLLARLPSTVPLELPEELGWTERECAPRPVLVIGRPNRWAQEPRTAELHFEYEGHRIGALDVRSRIEVGKREVIVRDQAAEASLRSRAGELGLRLTSYGREFALYESNVAALVLALAQEGWRIEVDGLEQRMWSGVGLELVSAIDWFDVRGGLEFGDQVISLPELLDSVRKGAPLTLTDGSVGLIPADLLKLSSALQLLGTREEGSYRFRKSQAAMLDALIEGDARVRVDEGFVTFRKRLREFDGVKPAEPPDSFRGTLRDYQKEAIGWFDFLREMRFGGCLADDMGLGKTIQVLALLEQRRTRRSPEGRPSIIVVPRSLIFNWIDEASRFTPKLKLLDHSLADRSRHETSHFSDYDAVLVTYGTLVRDAAHLAGVEWDYAILDEAQAIKNPSTRAAKAARLLNASHRLALSGTPIENHLGELWSLFEFLNPGILGSSARSFSKLAAPRIPSGSDRALISRAVRPFILRRTKEQVARELPQRTEQTIHCELEGRQKQLYDELRDYYRKSLADTIERQGLAKSKIHVLEALLRLRQAACHPRLVRKGIKDDECAKLETLLPRLSEIVAEGHKVLVFSQFTSFLAIVRERLEGHGIPYIYLDGATKNRRALVDQFQTDPKAHVFLISLKAGGLGLNLTAAEYVFLLDPWWNPAVEAQAIDRTHRIGQTKNVFAYRIVARDTIEEKILALQQSKRELADAILGEDKSLIRKLTREDLEFLLA